MRVLDILIIHTQYNLLLPDLFYRAETGVTVMVSMIGIAWIGLVVTLGAAVLDD